MPAKKILLVINADTTGKLDSSPDRRRQRLADYAALKATLAADLLDWNELPKQLWTRLLSRLAGKGVGLAVLAFLRRNRYDLIYCDSENNGLALALLLKLSFSRKPLAMIGHRLTAPKKQRLIKMLRLHTAISRIFLHCTPQYEAARDQIAIPEKKLQLLPYQTDTEFWQTAYATPPASKPYICTAGREFRDYPTLLAAVRDLPVDVKITVGSLWSKRSADALEAGQLPPNVKVSSYSFTELRDLYAGSLFVVVPLYPVDFQAGITLILEAMAMGKAVIVSRVPGQLDTVIGQGSSDPAEGHLLKLFAESELGPTGYYVPSGDPVALRQAIQHLLDNPEEARQLGQQARRTVASLLTVEQFAQRIKATLDEL